MSVRRLHCPTKPRPQPAPEIRLPAGPFRPDHCPNRECPFYEPTDGWEYRSCGYYRYKIHSEPLPRFQCKHCKRTFTSRTFSSTYWLHRWDLFAKIAAQAVAGSGMRQIGRTLGVSHNTVARHLARAGRHCLVAHRRMLAGIEIEEPVAVDGFETFEYSQFFPYHLNLAAGGRSWFLYHFTDSPLRRKGSMTAEQKARREFLEASLGKADPKAVENGMVELLRVIGYHRRPNASSRELCAQMRVEMQAATPVATTAATTTAATNAATNAVTAAATTAATLDLRSDDHPAYARAVRRLRALDPSLKIRHRITPSTDPRTRANALFPVNLADLLLRHCGADHRRETIAFGKRRQSGIERAALFMVWRNAIKPRREKQPDETAAMHAGILPGFLTWRQLFSKRQFPRESELPGSWWGYYWRKVKTLALGDAQSEHRKVYAF